MVAKVASDESKPDGLIEVPSGGEAVFLAPLAVRKLPGVGKKTKQVFDGEASWSPDSKHIVYQLLSG